LVKEVDFVVRDQKTIADNVCLLSLSGDTSAVTAPGQFVNVKLDGFFLRRPISVFDCEEDSLRLIYKIVGKGTDAMSRLSPGDTLNVLTGLGNGYDLSAAGPRPLLIGGGAGVPPLYWLCKKLVDRGAKPFALLGFNRAADVFCEVEFRELCGDDVIVATVDGSYTDARGRVFKGFVTDHLPGEYTYFYTCGPLPMLKAVYSAAACSGEFSFEERMGCGFGACMGCSVKTKDGYKRVCKDGPVLKKEEILWTN
jgi:dihydroorotate dehydrogenase electron transfer subunit